LVNCERTSFLDSGKQSGGLKLYQLYIGNPSGHEVYILDTDGNVVVDTLRWFDYDVWDLITTKNGRKLYVVTRDGYLNASGKIYSIDLQTQSVSKIWDGIASDVFVTPDGKVFIVSYVPRSAETYLGTIDLLTDKIAFFDTLDIRDAAKNNQAVVFDSKGRLMYAVNRQEQLFAYDYENKKLVCVYQNIYIPLHMVISHDGKYLYVAGGPVVDLERREAIASVGGNVLGSLALSPDGEYLYVTDPASYIQRHGTPLPSGKVFIYNTRTHQYVGEIDVSKNSAELYLTDWIVLLPDGKTAYVSNWGRLIFAIDLHVREVKKIVKLDSRIVPIAVGVKP
jgi:DNA-binding beta-propeller fold protein YncE